MIKTYALVGTGYRGLWSYCEPIVKEYSDVARLAAVCDINPLRARLVGEYLKADIPAYTDFDLMLREVRPDVVIVTTKDCAHRKAHRAQGDGHLQLPLHGFLREDQGARFLRPVGKSAFRALRVAS